MAKLLLLVPPYGLLFALLGVSPVTLGQTGVAIAVFTPFSACDLLFHERRATAPLPYRIAYCVGRYWTAYGLAMLACFLVLFLGPMPPPPAPKPFFTTLLELYSALESVGPLATAVGLYILLFVYFGVFGFIMLTIAGLRFRVAWLLSLLNLPSLSVGVYLLVETLGSL